MIEKIDNYLNGFLSDNKDFAGLSSSLQDKLKKWDNDKKPITRPHWNHYFMGLAYLISTRSSDARTRTGALLVDQNNSVLAIGYNGPIRGIDDRILPNFSDSKYPFFQHSEMNCLLNCCRQGIRTAGTICYVVGLPCFACTQALYQAGISKVFYGNKYINMLDNQDYKDNMELFNFLTGKSMPLIHIDFDENTLKELLK